MSGPESPPEPARPWWAPLLGVGSIGFAGFQVLAGLAFVAIALVGPEGAGRPFLLIGCAWTLPGILLGVGGAMITTGARGCRATSIAAVALGAALFAAVALDRTRIPLAIVETRDWSLKHPDLPPWARKLYQDVATKDGNDPLEMARDPVNADVLGWAYTGACCVPLLPWHLVVLLACAGPWGRRLAAHPVEPT